MAFKANYGGGKLITKAVLETHKENLVTNEAKRMTSNVCRVLKNNIKKKNLIQIVFNTFVAYQSQAPLDTLLIR